jgi:hypothetical protein
MRPTRLRQLYRVCVTRVFSYAASAWYEPGKVGVLRLTNALDKIQRLGARMILRAWNSVALPIVEVEACLTLEHSNMGYEISSYTWGQGNMLILLSEI